jgi:hypothetical protein
MPSRSDQLTQSQKARDRHARVSVTISDGFEADQSHQVKAATGAATDSKRRSVMGFLSAP